MTESSRDARPCVPRRIGVVGGGQLARMMVPPAINLGLDIAVFSDTETGAAALVTEVVGDFRDAEALERFASTVDVLTFDHELVPQSVLRELVARGIVVRPGPDSLLFAQDKARMRARLAELGVPIPDWALVASVDELEGFLREHGGAGVVKLAHGGYDGRGVRVVTDSDAVSDWLLDSDTTPLLVEEKVLFRRELAHMVARNPSGSMVSWPLVETVQRDGVCVEVISPAPGASVRLRDSAEHIARTIAEGLDVVGVMAVELFETHDDRLLVNELAMRPHNSGHWTIDGSRTSQFEQHLRAVADLPLGPTEVHKPWTVMVNIFGGPTGVSLRERYPAVLAAHPAVKIHNYGKTPRQGRKIGHVTASAGNLDEALYDARASAAFFED